MGFFNSLLNGVVNAANENLKQQYQSITGRNYDKDLRYYMGQFEYMREDELQDEWRELVHDTSVSSNPKRTALLEAMKKRNIPRDDY